MTIESFKKESRMKYTKHGWEKGKSKRNEKKIRKGRKEEMKGERKEERNVGR